MTIAEWLAETMKKLGATGADSPRRDALVLLEDTLKKERSWVLAHADYELIEPQLTAVNSLIERRMKREPLAYIRGKAWFYGRFFIVDKNVLIPRPETETFIELIKELSPSQLFDIGTGSGCIGVTAALEVPNLQVIATDTSSQALAIAKQNASELKATLGFAQTDLLSELLDFDFSSAVMAVNLPYVPDHWDSGPEVIAEPKEAVFSGDDGLDHYQRFWQQVAELENKPRYILTESLESQHNTIAQLAQEAGYELDKTAILIQQFKLNA